MASTRSTTSDEEEPSLGERHCCSSGVLTPNYRGLLQHHRPQLFAASWVLTRAFTTMPTITTLFAAEAVSRCLTQVLAQSSSWLPCWQTLRTSWLGSCHEDAVYTELEEVGNACALDPKSWNRGFDYGWLFQVLTETGLQSRWQSSASTARIMRNEE